MPAGLSETINPLHLMVDFKWSLTCPPYQPGGGNSCAVVAARKRGFIRANQDLNASGIPTAQAGVTETWAFAACPELEFEMIQTMKGGVQDDPFRILIPLRYFPVNVMVTNPFPQVEVDVWQARLGDAPGWGHLTNPAAATTYTRTLIATGTVAKTIARYNKRPDMVAIECNRFKIAMQSVTLGVTTSSRCIHRFGDSKCGYSLANATVSNALVETTSAADIIVRLEAAEGTTIGSGLTGLANGFPAFQHGFVEYDGLRAFVREHRYETGNATNIYNIQSGPVTLDTGRRHKLSLAFPAPNHPNYNWVNRKIKIVAGCTKNKSACITKWANAQNFGGFGILIPTYNPVWEIGGGSQQ